MTSKQMPLLDMIIDAGVDVLIGVDPIQGKGTLLRDLKQQARGRLSLWGGVNGFLTVEMGSSSAIQDAVQEALSILGQDGFILSPVDNVRDDSPETWRNIETLLRAWRHAVGSVPSQPNAKQSTP